MSWSSGSSCSISKPKALWRIICQPVSVFLLPKPPLFLGQHTWSSLVKLCVCLICTSNQSCFHYLFVNSKFGFNELFNAIKTEWNTMIDSCIAETSLLRLHPLISTMQTMHKMAVFVSWVFWLHSWIQGESWDVSSIFISSLPISIYHFNNKEWINIFPTNVMLCMCRMYKTYSS